MGPCLVNKAGYTEVSALYVSVSWVQLRKLDLSLNQPQKIVLSLKQQMNKRQHFVCHLILLEAEAFAYHKMISIQIHSRSVKIKASTK